MNEKNREDEMWIQQTLEGDGQAFGRLIGRFQVPLFDLALRVVRNRSDAEDVLQDSFVSTYKHLSRFHHASRFSTWIYSIVLNRARNHLRHARVLQWSSLDRPRFTDEGERPVELPGNDERLDSVVGRKLQVEAIKREAATLPERYQSVFWMHYIQDMPLAEIARRLNRPLGTVKVYLHRSRKMLHRRLGDGRFPLSGGDGVPALNVM